MDNYMNEAHRQSTAAKARDAILLLLYMGESSLRADWRGGHEIYSPLEGETLTVEDLNVRFAGPRGDSFHVTMSFNANGRHVNAHCVAACDGRGRVYLITDTVICVDQVWLTSRRVAIKYDGSLEPEGMDESYNLQYAIDASAYRD